MYVLHLSMIHSEFIFVKCTKSVAGFFFFSLALGFPVAVASFFEDKPFSSELPLFLCHRLVDYFHMGLFLGSHSDSFIFCLLFGQYHTV